MLYLVVIPIILCNTCATSDQLVKIINAPSRCYGRTRALTSSPSVKQEFVPGTILPSRYLASKGGIHSTEPFPCNDRNKYIDTKTYGEFYEVHR
jgi:hypothetical protein